MYLSFIDTNHYCLVFVPPHPRKCIGGIKKLKNIYNQVKIGISGHLTKTSGIIKVSIFKSPRYRSADTNFLNLVKGISFNDLTPNI